jgi:hypothetical protein
MALNLSEYWSWSVLDFTGKYSKVNLSEIQVNMKLLPEEQLPGVYLEKSYWISLNQESSDIK